MVYTRFSARRTTIQFFKEFANDDNLFNVFYQGLIQYWYVTLFIITICILLFVCYRPIKTTTTTLPTWAYYTSQSLLFVLCGYVTIMGIRGTFSWDVRPLLLFDAAQYTDSPHETNIVFNTPFTFIMSIGLHERYVSPHYYPETQVTQYMSPIHPATGDSTKLRPKNVIIFILESFSKEFSGFFNTDLDNGTYKGYTSFMDSIYAQSVTYKNSFAAGRKSVDAMPAVMSGIPTILSSFLRSIYSNNEVSSTADCLKRYGYHTSFFHGARNGSMNFDAFTHLCGFEHYYGMTEYGNDADFGDEWGIWDEEFLQFFGKCIDTFPRPFFTSIFTTTSHHPFLLPERYQGVFPEGPKPMNHSIGYTDYAVRKFFEQAQHKSWYDSTLFVFVADHTAEQSHREYLTAKGIYEIPIAFFTPDGDLVPEIRDGVIAQTDIMPSILAYLGYNDAFIAFGEDALMTPKRHPYAITYNDPLYQIFSDHLVVQFDGEKVTHIYDYTTDRLLQTNIIDKLRDDDEVQKMVSYLKAYVQQYIDRMNANDLTIK